MKRVKVICDRRAAESKMIVVPTNQLTPGDVLAKAIHSSSGIVLLDAGTVLTEAYIRRLRMLKIETVTMRTSSAYHRIIQRPVGSSDSSRADWVLPDIDRLKDNHESRNDAVNAARQFADTLQGLAQIKLPGPEGEFRKQFRDMFGDILSNRTFTEELGVIYQTDELLFRQSLQVTMCASVIGSVRRYDPDDLFNLTFGSLFSNIGMTRLPADLTKVARELTDAERKTVRAHTSEGYRILAGMRGVPLESAKVALQHHERYHGGGYPLGLKQQEISEFAQIVGISDVFNALLSSRYHRKAYAIEEATEYLFAAGNYEFDLSLIHTYLQHLTVYPPGTHVIMNSGQTAYVVNAAGRPVLRPVVQVYREADGSTIASPFLVDLEQHPYLAILRRVNP